jgi:hypothetical protein
MNIQSIRAVYFSANGTTKKVTSTLAEEAARSLSTGCGTTDFTLPSSRDQPLEFRPDELIILEIWTDRTAGSSAPLWSNVSSIPGKCIKRCACIRQCPVNAKHFTEPAFLAPLQMLEGTLTHRAEPECYLGACLEAPLRPGRA